MPSKLNRKEKPRLWKDHLDKNAVSVFGKQITEVYPKFNQKKYAIAVLSDGFLKLELKERLNRMSEALASFLPSNYDSAVKILIEAAPKVGTFENWALTIYVEKFGLKHFKSSVHAMQELTKYGTSEFAIRPFMIQHTVKMLPILMKWTESPNEHIRRLAAEGSRPRGVWVAHIEAFKKDARPVIEILAKLKSDESLYVRKAVANNLNDISKEHPDLVAKTCQKWQEDNHTHTDWIIKHGCRTLVKNGHPEVMKLFGFANKPNVRIKLFSIRPSRINIGGMATLVLKLSTGQKSKQKLSIDYRVYFVSKNGFKSKRLFKWAVKSIDNQSNLTLEKRQSFIDQLTRKHFPGAHKIEVLINGSVVASKSVMLSSP
ncbi:MAG: DNA alkylation repair protein [candidate division Zixibacteria bacterium]|nr:DNA alkylation repair protein [candidate division Zixibacteria bacterium]